jgi:hypothetical protein
MINPATLARVQRLRRIDPFAPMSMATAVSIVRYEVAPVPERLSFLEDLDVSGTVSGTVDGLEVSVTIDADPYSRLGEDDVTGHFTDASEPGAVRNLYPDWTSQGAYYVPANYRQNETREEYSARGMSRAVAADAMRAAIVSDMRDDATRAYYDMVVTVSLDGRELATQALGGIDVIDRMDGMPYFREMATDLIDEATQRVFTDAPELIAAARAYADHLEEVLGH